MGHHLGGALILGSLVLSVITSGAAPAAASPGRSPWIGVGLGGGRFSGVGGIAGHVEAGCGFGNVYAAGRLTAVTDSIGCCDVTEGDRSDAALTVGLQRVTETSVLSVGAGPAFVRGQDFGDDSWGLGLEARLASLSGRVGIGLYAFANVNSTSSFFGATLALRIGCR